MKKVIQHKKKMKKTLFIVFGVYSLVLFCITSFNPSYASEGILLDSVIESIVGVDEAIDTTVPLNHPVSDTYLGEEETSEVQDEEIQNDENMPFGDEGEESYVENPQSDESDSFFIKEQNDGDTQDSQQAEQALAEFTSPSGDSERQEDTQNDDEEPENVNYNKYGLAVLAGKLGIDRGNDSKKWAILAGIEDEYYGTAEQNEIIRLFLVENAEKILNGEIGLDVQESQNNESDIGSTQTSEPHPNTLPTDRENEEENNPTLIEGGAEQSEVEDVNNNTQDSSLRSEGQSDTQNDEQSPEGQTITKSQELENAWKTLNTAPIAKSYEHNKVRVNVKAPEGSFPEGTKLVIKPIDKGNANKVAFDISFIYTYSDGSEVELQPKEGSKVQVTFNYENNEEWLNGLNKGGELKVTHTHAGNKENVKVTDKGEGSLTLDMDKFSEIEVELVKGGTENTKDIIIQATSTEANQTLKINKYFANAYTVDRGDGSEVENLTADTTHTYTTAGTYNIILSLAGGADRWTFQKVSKSLVPNNGITGVKIIEMPSLADGFGYSATNPGNYFFKKFNYYGALTSLPENSFQFPELTTAGGDFFAQFNDGGQLTSLPENSFQFPKLTTVGIDFFSSFNQHGVLTSLPENSFQFPELTTVGDRFFGGFNYNGSLVSLPENSFQFPKLTTVGNGFFPSFNYNGSLTSLPENSFQFPELTTAGDDFFRKFNYNGSLTNLPDSFKLVSTAYNKSNAYNDAFYSPNYTLNRNVSDLVAGLTGLTSDQDVFSDNQPGRCGVDANWLWNPVSSCDIIITFNTNGGDEISTMSVGNGGKVVLPKPTNLIAIFEGWYETDENDTMPGGSVYTATANTTLNAKWGCEEGKMYNGSECTEILTVTYDSNGGNSVPEPETAGENTQIQLPSVSRDGYTFLGWYTEVGGGTRVGGYNDNYTVTESITLYAHRERGPTVTFDANGGATSALPVNVALGTDINLSNYTSTKNDYDFMGWNTSSTATDVLPNSYIVNGDITLYAVYRRLPRAWTVESGDFYPLTVSGGGVSFTIMDRNLGATDVADGTKYNYNAGHEDYSKLGYYYQWGNNYGFANNGYIATSPTQVDTSGYGPNNYYYSNIFITRSNSDWSLIKNDNLWGGSGDTTTSRGQGTDVDRRGPCPEGYHVPSILEWQKAYNIWNTANAMIIYSGSIIVAKAGNKGSNGKNFAYDLKLPFAGSFANSFWYQGYDGIYSSSSPSYTNQVYYMFFSDDFLISDNQQRWGASSVRCFENSQAKTLIFDYNGGSGTYTQPTSAIWWGNDSLSTASNTTKTGYIFDGWYTTSDFQEGTQVTTNAISDDSNNSTITLYAKRKKQPSIWTVASGDFYPITVFNGTKSFTIMDRNLGATDVADGTYYNNGGHEDYSKLGYYYQWGNNYGFANNGSLTTNGNSVNASAYGPNTDNGYYSSSTFITSYQWDSSYNMNLWGGSGDARGYRGIGADADRRGPCPEGYHIPSSAEWQTAYDIYNGDNVTVSYLGDLVAKSTDKGSNTKNFAYDLKLPFAGYRYNSNASLNSQGSYSSYWTSSPSSLSSAYPEYYYFYSSSMNTSNDNTSKGYSVRCFKDSDTAPSSFNVSFDDSGIDEDFNGDDIQGTIGWYDAYISLPNIRNNQYFFIGWYTAPQGGTMVGGINDIYNPNPGNTTLYAHWEPRPKVRFLDGDDVIVDVEMYTNWCGTTDYGNYVCNLTWEEITQNSDFEEYISQKEGQIFLGRYLDQDLTEEFDFENMTIEGDLDLYAKWESCPSGNTVVNNKCISSNAGVYYEDGYVEIRNGDKVVYIKDRNQGAENSLNLFNEYLKCYGDSFGGGDIKSSRGAKGPVTDEEECRPENEILSDIGDLLGIQNASVEDIMEYEESTYGDYYYRGNNTGATREELGVKIVDLCMQMYHSQG